MKDFIYEELRERVKDMGITLGPEDAEGNIEIKRGAWEWTINLTNARATYARTGSLDHLDKIIESFHNNLMGQLVPSWEDASPTVYTMLSAAPSRLNDDYIIDEVVTGVYMVYVFYDKGRYTWIGKSILSIWGITEEEMKGRCTYNSSIMLDECGFIPLALPGYGKLLGLNAEISWLNTAMAFQEGFKEKIKKKLGWPIYLAMPTREFCYVMHVNEKKMLPILKELCQDIYKHEDLHLTKQIFIMSDSGLKAVDKF